MERETVDIDTMSEADCFRLLLPHLTDEALTQLLTDIEVKERPVPLDDVDDLLLRLLREEEMTASRRKDRVDAVTYDVFISCKSQDYAYARKVNNLLTDKGLKVFFSEMMLQELRDSVYFSQINSALEAAVHMVVVGSRRGHLESKWVRNEWETFCNEKNSGRKDGNLVNVLAAGMDPKDLPIALRQYEAIALVPGQIERLTDYVMPVKESP